MIRIHTAIPIVAFAVASCGSGARTPAPPPASAGGAARAAFVVRDTAIRANFEASGIAAPIREATLATRLMGSVTDVLVHEGERVRAGAVLARIDARDVNARETQAAAGIAQAGAMLENTRTRASRLRALYADSAAPRAQLDDAEAGLARAEAGVRAARGAAAEVDAMRAYADIRAPFDGTIVKRFADPGAFVAPGAPIITIQDASRLRISVTVAPSDTRGIARGARLAARIENQPATAIVEGVVPAATGALYVINAIAVNGSRKFLAGAAGTLLLPRPARTGILLPETVLVREGDLTGVYVRGASGSAELRWLQVALADSGRVEVLAGLRAGETVEIPVPSGREK